MDKHYIAQRLRKYLFFISIVFMMLTTIHLIYSYLYSDSKNTAIKGWTISEALIGKTPNLNPLKNIGENNKYLNFITYRSLLKYNSKTKEFVPDLAKCSKNNLLKIECYLDVNAKWSNWDSISYDDIIATFDTLKKYNTNSSLSQLLKNIEIKKTNNSIIFKSSKKDIKIMKLFLQPIVSKKILDIISPKEIKWNFSLASWIYSWKYKIVNIVKDETWDITTITLERNDQYYKNNAYIKTILLKIYPNIWVFLKNKNSINIFNDKNNLIKWTVPNLKWYDYTLNQYTSIFLNTKRLKDNKFRNLILKEIDRDEIIKKIWKDKFKKVENPYINEDIFIKDMINYEKFSTILNKKWYFSVSDLKEKLKQDLQKEENNTNTWKILDQLKNISWEIKIEKKQENKKQEKKLELNSAKEKIDNPKSKIIFSPNWVEKYNFITRDSYLLKWKTRKNTTSVYINDYKLKSFKPYSKEFVYRIATKMKNLKSGQNTYKIYFVINNKKVFIEEINFYLGTKKELEKAKKDILYKKQENKEDKKVEIKKQEKNNNISKKENIENIKSDKSILLEKKLEKIKQLDKKYYYNKDLEAFSLELYYISAKKDLSQTAEYIADKLEKKWIKVNLRAITIVDLNQLLKQWSKNYDLLLTWINLWYFDFDISSNYSSDEIDKNHNSNFSNFQLLDLDIVLQELKTKLLTKDKRFLLEKKAFKIIKNNNLSKTLYTPIFSNLVDGNIKWYKLFNNLADDIYRIQPIYKSYVNQDKKILLDNKNFNWYIKFLYNSLF